METLHGIEVYDFYIRIVVTSIGCPDETNFEIKV